MFRRRGSYARTPTFCRTRARASERTVASHSLSLSPLTLPLSFSISHANCTPRMLETFINFVTERANGFRSSGRTLSITGTSPGGEFNIAFAPPNSLPPDPSIPRLLRRPHSCRSVPAASLPLPPMTPVPFAATSVPVRTLPPPLPGRSRRHTPPPPPALSLTLSRKFSASRRSG